jgi:hypothetical protein
VLSPHPGMVPGWVFPFDSSGFSQSGKERLVPTVKKIIAMLLLCAFLFTGVVGCGGDSTTTKKDKDGMAAKDKDKEKDKK